MSEPGEMSPPSREFLKALYFDATATIRHYDGERAAFTRIFASLLAILVSAVTAATLRESDSALVPLAAGAALALSVLALAAVLKFDALIAHQRARARAAMRAYEVAAGDVHLSGVNAEARVATRGPGSRFSLHAVWVAIFVLTTAVTATIVVLVLELVPGLPG